MALNDQCPKCQKHNMEINDYFLMLERTVAVWRTCPYCWHKWKEIYDMVLVRIEDSEPKNIEED